MTDRSGRPDPLQAECDFRDFLRNGGIAQPDAVEHDPEAEEIIFIWHEPKFAVVLELTERRGAPDGWAYPPAPV